MNVIGLWISYKSKYIFQTLIFNIDGDQYNAFTFQTGKLDHVSCASLSFVEDKIADGSLGRHDDFSDFNSISRRKKKQVMRRFFSSDPGNVDNCLRAKK